MAITKHNLPTKGAWVKLRGYDDLRAKHRKRALAGRLGALQFDPTTGKTQAFTAQVAVVTMLTASEDVAAMLITDWHIPYFSAEQQQLPVEDHPELVEELRIEDSNRLLELTEPIRRKLLEDKKPVDPSDFADPDSPSRPESG
jgi:hypothetical protein